MDSGCNTSGSRDGNRRVMATSCSVGETRDGNRARWVL